MQQLADGCRKVSRNNALILRISWAFARTIRTWASQDLVLFFRSLETTSIETCSLVKATLPYSTQKSRSKRNESTIHDSTIREKDGERSGPWHLASLFPCPCPVLPSLFRKKHLHNHKKWFSSSTHPICTNIGLHEALFRAAKRR